MEQLDESVCIASARNLGLPAEKSQDGKSVSDTEPTGPARVARDPVDVGHRRFGSITVVLWMNEG